MKNLKKMLYASVVTIVLVMFVGTGCQKESGLMTWWGKLWYHEYAILEQLNTAQNTQILPKIDWARTSLDAYMTWDGDTVALHGPAGYGPLADKATRVFISKYQEVMLPDTSIGATTGELPKIMLKFLELRRDNSANQSWKKLRLTISKDLYNWDPRAWEFMLDKLYAYLTGPLGGSIDWFNGERDHQLEMDIRNVLTLNDPEDPWGYNLPATTRIRDKYLRYAEGNNKSMVPMDDIEVVRATSAQKRYEHFKDLPGLETNPDDFATKTDGNWVYVDIPVPPAAK